MSKLSVQPDSEETRDGEALRANCGSATRRPLRRRRSTLGTKARCWPLRVAPAWVVCVQLQGATQKPDKQLPFAVPTMHAPLPEQESGRSAPGMVQAEIPPVKEPIRELHSRPLGHFSVPASILIDASPIMIPPSPVKPRPESPRNWPMAEPPSPAAAPPSPALPGSIIGLHDPCGTPFVQVW